MDECPCYYKGTWYSEGDQITDNCFIKYVMTPSLDCPSGQSWNRFSVDVDNNGDGNNVYNVVEFGHAKDTTTTTILLTIMIMITLTIPLYFISLSF